LRREERRKRQVGKEEKRRGKVKRREDK